MVFGLNGQYLDEAAIDAVLRDFCGQMERAEKGLREKIREPPGLFRLILAATLPKAPWNFNWCPDGKRQRRE